MMIAAPRSSETTMMIVPQFRSFGGAIGRSVARARVEPGRTTRWHRLDAITERYVILEGRGRAEVDGLARDVQPGDVVIIAPGLPQRITNTGDEDLVFLAVCTPRFEPSAYSEIPELENTE